MLPNPSGERRRRRRPGRGLPVPREAAAAGAGGALPLPRPGLRPLPRPLPRPRPRRQPLCCGAGAALSPPVGWGRALHHRRSRPWGNTWAAASHLRQQGGAERSRNARSSGASVPSEGRCELPAAGAVLTARPAPADGQTGASTTDTAAASRRPGTERRERD